MGRPRKITVEAPNMGSKPHYGEMSYSEIASVLNLSIEAVRKIEKRALEKIKRFENRFRLEDIAETIAMLNTQQCVNGALRL